MKGIKAGAAQYSAASLCLPPRLRVELFASSSESGVPRPFLQLIAGAAPVCILNFFMVEQLPTLPPAFYGETLHGQSWESLIAPRALELSYTCEALRPLAQACGYEGDPYPWNPARRRILRAQLDALFFLAYGFDAPEDEPALDHILGTFPIQNEQDPAYAELVKGHVRAYRAGALQAVVAG